MTEKITGIVTKVETKTGEKNGKPWRRAAYTLNEQIYSTFDADIIESVKEGANVEVEYTTTPDGKYRNIQLVKKLDGVESTEIPNGTQVSEPVEHKPDINLSIVRQSSIKSAIELVKDNNLIDVIIDTSTSLEEFVCRTK